MSTEICSLQNALTDVVREVFFMHLETSTVQTFQHLPVILVSLHVLHQVQFPGI